MAVELLGEVTVVPLALEVLVVTEEEALVEAEELQAELEVCPKILVPYIATYTKKSCQVTEAAVGEELPLKATAPASPVTVKRIRLQLLFGAWVFTNAKSLGSCRLVLYET